MIISFFETAPPLQYCKSLSDFSDQQFQVNTFILKIKLLCDTCLVTMSALDPEIIVCVFVQERLEVNTLAALIWHEHTLYVKLALASGKKLVVSLFILSKVVLGH